MKTCTKCGETKAVSEFHKQQDKPDGLRAHCKICIRSARKIYYRDNSDREKERNRGYYADHREQYAEHKRRWNKENPERKRDYFRRYGQENKERIAVYQRSWCARNRELLRARASARRVLVGNGMTYADRELSVSYRKAIAHDPCFYCGELCDEMHVDHMTPLSRGGTDHWWNLTRACGLCNRRKHAKTAEEFMELT